MFLRCGVCHKGTNTQREIECSESTEAEYSGIGANVAAMELLVEELHARLKRAQLGGRARDREARSS